MVKRCMFCSTPLRRDNRSQEHVFPDWILRYFQIGDEIISPQGFQGTDELAPVRRHPLAAFRVGGCASPAIAVGCPALSRMRNRSCCRLVGGSASCLIWLKANSTRFRA